MSFQNGTEYRLSLDGESWEQGQTIRGKLEVLATESAPAFVLLAIGNEKKIKAKSEDAFEILAQVETRSKLIDFEFPLQPTTRISDKAASIYVLYGAPALTSSTGSPSLDGWGSLLQLGRLRLPILPHHYLQDLLDLLRTEFRFALKKLTAGKKEFVEADFSPPASKDWAQLDHLLIRLTLDGPATRSEGALLVYFEFFRAEVDSLKAGLSTRLTKREVSREAELQYLVHDFNDRLNKEAAEEMIRGMFEEYQSAGWLS